MTGTGILSPTVSVAGAGRMVSADEGLLGYFL